MTNGKKDRHPREETLHLHAEGALRDDRAEEVEDHLRSCGPCRREVEELRDLLRSASELPRGIAPDRDLWDGIEARIRGEGETGSDRGRDVLELRPDSGRGRSGGEDEVSTGAAGRGAGAAGGETSLRSVAPWLAAAAAVLVAVTAGATLWLSGGGGATEGATGPVASAADTGRQGPATTVEWTGVESGYRSSVDRLADLLEQRRDRLPPETREVLDRNLRIIDQAIREAERALAENPGSPEAVRALDRTYQRKIDLLRRSARLTAQL